MRYFILTSRNADFMIDSGVEVIEVDSTGAKAEDDIKSYIKETHLINCGYYDPEEYTITEYIKGMPGFIVESRSEDGSDCFIGYMPYDASILAFLFEPNVCEVSTVDLIEDLQDLIEDALNDDSLDNSELTSKDILNGALFDSHGQFGLSFTKLVTPFHWRFYR